MKDETFLGGFSSADLQRGYIRGYGIYATDKRLFGVSKRKAAFSDIGGAGAVFAATGIVGAVALFKAVERNGHKFGTDQNPKAIHELEEKHDFEIAKEQVSRIEVKEPKMRFGIGRPGLIVITPKTGELIKLYISAKTEFAWARDLMKLFYPEVVTVDE